MAHFYKPVLRRSVPIKINGKLNPSIGAKSVFKKKTLGNFLGIQKMGIYFGLLPNTMP